MSVWACLELKQALNYKNMLVSTEGVGDFGGWVYNYVKLNFALDSILSNFSSNNKRMHDQTLEEMSSLVLGFSDSDGVNYGLSWEADIESLQNNWEAVMDGINQGSLRYLQIFCH